VIERGHHDMGGLPAGRVEPDEHDYAEWERRVDALVTLLRTDGTITVDELRKNIEAIGPAAYDRMSYYERWITSLTQTLLQRGVITTAELAARLPKVTSERQHHDMGGQPAGKVERSEHGYADWELRVDALRVALGKRITVDERRKLIEGLPPEAYDAMGYYDRWVVSLAQALLARGIITSEDLARKMQEVRGR
jgi:Nitrile hydratase beta subunit